MKKRGRDDDDELEKFDEEANRAHVDDEAPERESRGEKKRRAEQLERLGEELVKLPDTKLARVALPDDLRAAVLEAKRIRHTHGGYRRQIQFIGRIMRGIDAVPIAAALEALKHEDAPSAAAFKAAERWRDRLIAEGDAALELLVAERPEADRTMLRQLARQAAAEKERGRPPRAARELFRALHALLKLQT
jgi:ribosome-associated protein